MKFRILVVEDDPRLVSALFEYLKSEGLAVKINKSVTEAVILREPQDDIQSHSFTQYSFGPVSVDFLNGTVVRDGLPVVLSSTQLRLLRHLIIRRGEGVPRDELLRAVWGYSAGNTRTLDVHIAALRQKLEEVPREPQYILTVRNKGYMFRD